jgi:MoaA/NifB/PqqE/SkfB family radical SAM enzyme
MSECSSLSVEAAQTLLGLQLNSSGHREWKTRRGPLGIHLFDRVAGLNILVDEIQVPRALWSKAPRHVSIGLTNRCDLACAHCFTPNSRDDLCYTAVTSWLAELDANGTLGVGFGGGEPTLYRRFSELCRYAARKTKLSVTFTTHGHHIDPAMAEELRGCVHFIRVSMDGVGDTYESIRRRSFPGLQARMKIVRDISCFGINIIVNERTMPELDEAATVAADSGATELLLLPQVAVRRMGAVTDVTLQALRRWVDEYSGPLKLCINESHAVGFPTCEPLLEERGLRAYAHIDAAGVIKPTSYHSTGVPIGSGRVLDALDQLTHDVAEKNA